LIFDENNRTNVSESTEKLTSERKSLVKQQLLMYKTQFIGYLTAVLHIKSCKYLKKVLHGSTLTLRRCIAASSPFSDICCF